MNIISVDIVGNDIILRTQSGLVETVFPYGQPDGYVEFQNVRWDYSFVYLLGVTGNVGTFTGEKMFFWLVVIGVMWFLLMRPQKKEQKRIQQMLASMEVGDTALTT